jgi:hypothetical protein
MNEVYEAFPIRDQDTDQQRTLDLLQGWRSPRRGSFWKSFLGVFSAHFRA